MSESELLDPWSVVFDYTDAGTRERAAIVKIADSWEQDQYELDLLRAFVVVFDRYQRGEATNAELEAARAVVDYKEHGR